MVQVKVQYSTCKFVIDLIIKSLMQGTDVHGATCEWHRTTTTKVTTSSVTWTYPEVNLIERTSWPSHSVSHSHSSPAQYLHFPSRRFCRCSISWSVSTPADVTALTSGSDVIHLRFNTIASRRIATNWLTNKQTFFIFLHWNPCLSHENLSTNHRREFVNIDTASFPSNSIFLTRSFLW